MNVGHGLAVVSFGAGVVVVTLSVVAALRFRHAGDRLHLLTPTTSLGTPLVGLGLVLQNGWSLTSAQIAITCILLAATGPVLASATARVAALRDGSIPQESPE
jgi:multicomponent Na+:H+ antiporter subunit G